VTLHGVRTHPDVTFAANLERTPPTGHIILAGDVLTLHEARELHRRLGEALERLDAVIVANSPEARAA
jgi:hypothetical protein